MSEEKLTQWSLSRLQAFELCPYRVKLQYIDKKPGIKSKSADRGSSIHKEAEDFITGKAEFSKHLKNFYPEFEALRIEYEAGRATCEEEWGFDQEWNVAPWETAWLRMKCDCVVRKSETELLIVDFKTGQRHGNEIKHQQQLQLYAVAGLVKYPEVENVECELWYLDKNILTSFPLCRDELDKYLQIFTEMGIRICSETEFKPNPNLHSCRFCPYNPDKENECEEGISTKRQEVKIEVPADWVPPEEYKDQVAEFLSNFGRK